MACTFRGHRAHRLCPRSASRNDTSEEHRGRAGICRGTHKETRACATSTNEECARNSTRTGRDTTLRRVTGVEGLLQDRVKRQVPARLRKISGMFSIEECRIRNSSAGDRTQSVLELERSARPRGKKCSRGAPRSGAGVASQVTPGTLADSFANEIYRRCLTS
jgi:hypothetical protein